MSFKCEVCDTKIDDSPRLDLVECPHCQNTVPTGNEKKIRRMQEAYKNSLRWPKAAAGRAIAYAAAIYAYSTHGTAIDYQGIEDKIRKKYGDDSAAHIRHRTVESGRSGAGVVDERVGLIMFTVSGTMGVAEVPWRLMYVIFRGSRGSEAESEDNPEGAGWGKTETGEMRNVDWRSNFNTAQVTPSWSTDVKVHKGFNEIYSSVRHLVHQHVNAAIQTHPNTQVITTGHSLGAGLATLCAHDLQSSGVCHPFCFPFCSPRAGDLAFARDFNFQIAHRYGLLLGEPGGGGAYHRCFVFVQSNDPVSWGGEHGFEHDMSAKSAKKVADSGNIAKQGLYAMLKKKSPSTIYYHVGNLYRASYFGLHSFEKMEKEILG